MFGWWSQHARHKLVTSLATCTICRGRRERGATWKKCSQHGKSVRNTMFGYWSQHARHKLATCSPQTRNIARNMYTMLGKEGGGRNMEKCLQHGKSFRNMGKAVRNIPNMLRNIMIRQLICFMIRIVWLEMCLMLAPGSDVRALAVPAFSFHRLMLFILRITKCRGHSCHSVVILEIIFSRCCAIHRFKSMLLYQPSICELLRWF
jgi:hypothetical protein